MKKYQIAFFDIDGTLINPKAMTQSLTDGVPDSTKEAIHQLKEKGIIPVIATGRWHGVVKELAQSLEIDTLVTSNGQELIHKGEVLHQQFIDQSMIEKVYQEVIDRDIAAFFDTNQGIFTIPGKEVLIDRGIETVELKQGQVPQEVFQVLVNTDSRESVTDWLTELKVVKTGPQSLDVIPFSVSKASGIEILLDKLNIPMEEALAFGDEENDLEMFQAVGTPVAMGNAIPALKERAAFVTKEVWNDGIYYACQELKLF